MRIIALFAVSAVVCAAQVCGPAPEIKTAIEQNQKLPIPAARLEAARALRDQHPDNLWVQRAYMNRVQDKEAVIAEYRKALENHPDDANYLYYRGSSLVGIHTPDAIKYLEQALEKDPDLVPAHQRLVTVYASANFKNADKLRSHLEAYLKACPDTDLSMYNHLQRMDAPELVKEGAVNLRKALAAREDPNDYYYYSTLWAIEFKAHPPSEYDQVREQVRADLERLRKISLADHKQLAYTLREGYKLVDDKEGQKWVDEQAPQAHSSGSAVMEAYQQFNKEHPFPNGTTTRDKMEERNKALLAASAEWVKNWPDEEFAWSQRYQALSMSIHGADPAFDEVADAQLRLASKSSNSASLKLNVASMYLAHNMHLDRIEALVKEGLADLDKQPADPPSDLYTAMNTANSRVSLLNTRINGLNTLCDLYQRKENWDQLEPALSQLHSTLDEQKKAGFPQSFQENMWKGNYSRYWQKMAALAEHQDHKLDALAFYKRALDPEFRDNNMARFTEPAVEKKAKVLWASLGGSEDAWAEWIKRGDAPKSGSAAKPAVATNFSSAPEASKPLPPFTITDVAGRKWTLADLKGKTTLVNLWATWCGPCRDELPHLQKLYDRVKDRKDIAIITLNTDDNPGLIDPFLKENHYTFPVLPAREYVDILVPSLSIPRNWIVNKQGVLDTATVGFNRSDDDWADKMLKSLENAGGAPASTAPSANEPPRPKVAVNSPLPEFALHDIAGKAWTVAEIHGKVTFINLWATWCGPCRKELPLVQQLYDRIKDRSDIQVITLNVDEKTELIKPFLEKNHFTFPVIPGRAYAHSVVPKQLGIPTTWTLNKEGIVKATSFGYNSGTAKVWVDRTTKALEKLANGRD